MIPKYVVFNTNVTDRQGQTLPVGQGNDLDEFAQSRGHRDWIEFKAYEEPETVREARKMIERGY